MLASQQFCVKWNSYSSNLQNVFPRLLTSEHFVDITLACEGQMIKCHKVVLSACSTYFEKLLVHNPCQHPIIFMKDMKHWEVQALVDFMYKGEVNVSQDELNSLLVAAEALQIRGLCGSDSVNRSTTQDVNRHGQSNTSSASSRVPSVSLPHDTVLSGGTSVGRESPPFKRRRPPNEEKDHSQSHHTSMPRIANITSTTPNSRGDVNSLPAPQASAVDHIKTDGFAEEMEDELPDKKPIKQELDMDDTFLEGDLDADGPDEDYGSLEHQEDSDSNNREEVPPHSPLDQPGPSGLAPPCSTPLDKAATGEAWNRFALSAFPSIGLPLDWSGNTVNALGQLNKCLEDVYRRIPASGSGPSNRSRGRKPAEGSPWHTDGKVRGFISVKSFGGRDPIPGSSQMPDYLTGSRINRRRSVEEKALRKLEMARLRQRRFRARMKLKAAIEAATQPKATHLC